MEKFWIKEPSMIINNCWEIIPNKDMNIIKKLNAITRLLILFLVLILLFKRETIYIVLILVFILVIIIFYYMYISDDSVIDQDLLMSNDEIEEYTPDNFYCPKDGCKINCMDDCPKELLKNPKLSETNGPINSIYNDPNYRDLIMKDGSTPNVILQSGYIDSDGNYRLGTEYTQDTPDNKKPKLNYEADKKYKKSKCRKPTADNPYMNVVFSDYLDAANVPEPCNSDQTKDDAQYLYNSTVYRNIEDVYERQNSQRLFYTLPITTIPNKQGEFADWLYKTGPQCKENTSKCTYFEEPYMVSQRY